MPPLRVWFLRRFGLETGMELLVGVVGVYERIYHVNSKCGEREIWEFQINFKKSFLLAF